MPIYEYACTACGERTEAKQSFADPPLTECSLCGGSLRKLYSPVGIVFKGSGFYSTDAKKKPTSRDGAAGTDKKDDSKGSKGSKESKDSTSTAGGTKKESPPNAKPKTEKSA